MKAVLTVFVTLFFASAGFAAVTAKDVKKCELFALGFAEGVYMAGASGIQGHEWNSSVESYFVDNQRGLIIYNIGVTGSNDEGDVWDVRYEVTVTNKCALDSYNVTE